LPGWRYWQSRKEVENKRGDGTLGGGVRWGEWDDRRECVNRREMEELYLLTYKKRTHFYSKSCRTWVLQFVFLSRGSDAFQNTCQMPSY